MRHFVRAGLYRQRRSGSLCDAHQTTITKLKTKTKKQRAAKALAALDHHAAETTTLLLVRHGETSFNAEGRLQGQLFPGPSLTQEGAAQARAMGAALASLPPPAAIYASDLARAVETATAIAAAFPAPPPPLTQIPSLRERDVGRLLEGVRRAEAPSIAPEAFAALRRSAHDPSLPLPGGGESLEAVAQRVGTALLDIARAHPGEVVVVVSHGGAIHAARRYAEGAGGGGGGSGSSGGGPLPNGALCEFRVHAGLAVEEQQSLNGTVARCPGGQWRKGWAIARWGDCCLLGQRAAQAGTEGGGADAG